VKNKILFDGLVWLALLGIMPVIVHANTQEDKVKIMFSIWGMIILLFYPGRWLLEAYFRHKRWHLTILGVFALLCAYSACFEMMFWLTDAIETGTIFDHLVASFSLFLLPQAVGFGYKGILLKIQYEKTKRAQVEAELKLLQAQVNPHFLFNTLNNIYALNLQNHEEANEMILHLADLMRYQTESGKKDLVLLDDEIEFLQSYIALERKRLHSRTTVQFDIERPTDAHVRLPPMLFVSFVENAFKHGVGIAGDSTIRFEVKTDGRTLQFVSENPIPTQKNHQKSTQTGLENARRRLGMLYPARHQLRIDQEHNRFNVHLTIQL
jgi:hypothetical protein